MYLSICPTATPRRSGRDVPLCLRSSERGWRDLIRELDRFLWMWWTGWRLQSVPTTSEARALTNENWNQLSDWSQFPQGPDLPSIYSGSWIVGGLEAPARRLGRQGHWQRDWSRGAQDRSYFPIIIGASQHMHRPCALPVHTSWLADLNSRQSRGCG